jgi:hypothetical protein
MPLSAKLEISAGDSPCLNPSSEVHLLLSPSLQCRLEHSPIRTTGKFPAARHSFPSLLGFFLLGFDRPHSPLQRYGVQLGLCWERGESVVSIYRGPSWMLTLQGVRLFIADATSCGRFHWHGKGVFGTFQRAGFQAVHGVCFLVSWRTGGGLGLPLRFTSSRCIAQASSVLIYGRSICVGLICQVLLCFG